MTKINKTYILDAIILWLCAPIGTILLILIPNSALDLSVTRQHEIVIRSVHFLYLIIFSHLSMKILCFLTVLENIIVCFANILYFFATSGYSYDIFCFFKNIVKIFNVLWDIYLSLQR